MPQMAPLNWLMLFIFFTLIFFLYNSLNYYIFNYKINLKSQKKNKISFYWKW
uniref:ATP synthase complex subunit 8 n=1 Tax=Stenurella nigra TaxID=294817 RepID=U3KZT9_9CUCU|nr:ATP synthase F0 subunit 8 [Stenurella nigra]ARH54666.1 ATP synthase F0 subunit 8 [Stenurella nigra]